MIAYNWKQFTKNGFYIGNKGVENYNIITNSYNIYHNYTGIPVDKFNKLTYCDLQPSYPDDIMIHSLTQQSCITIITSESHTQTDRQTDRHTTRQNQTDTHTFEFISIKFFIYVL